MTRSPDYSGSSIDTQGGMVVAFLSILAHQTTGMFFIPRAWPVACTMSSTQITLFLYLGPSFQLVSWLWYHIHFLLIHLSISLSSLERQTQDDTP